LAQVSRIAHSCLVMDPTPEVRKRRWLVSLGDEQLRTYARNHGVASEGLSQDELVALLLHEPEPSAPPAEGHDEMAGPSSSAGAGQGGAGHMRLGPSAPAESSGYGHLEPPPTGAASSSQGFGNMNEAASSSGTQRCSVSDFESSITDFETEPDGVDMRAPVIQLQRARGIFLGFGRPEQWRIVLVNPDAPGRGIVLREMSDRSLALGTFRQLAQNLEGILDGDSRGKQFFGGKVPSNWPDLYASMGSSTKLRAALVEEAQTEFQAATQASSTQEVPLLHQALRNRTPEESGASVQGPGAALEEPETREQDPDEERDSCPICLDDINPEQGVMRCTNNHYFHDHCLVSWIRSRPAGRATCPTCRGELQVHGSRLRQFLDSPEGQRLPADQRSFLGAMADRMREVAPDGWGHLITADNLRTAGQMVIAAGYGLHSGYNVERYTEADARLLEQMPRHAQLTAGVAWAGGMAARLVVEAHRARESDDNRRRNNRRRS